MKINWALFALAVSAFGIGSTEFVIMGILPQVSESFQVSIPTAGLLVSIYALGVAVGAPLLAMATRHISRKSALLILMGIFIVGNALCALATSYALMMVARVITSFSHGAFFGIGAIIATHVVAPNKRASAIALMFMGLTLANVVGVSFGTWIAHHWNWHLSFWLIAGVGVFAFLAILCFIPRCGQCEQVQFGQELSVLKDKKVLSSLGVTVFTFGSVFALFTYIAPLLLNISHLPMQWLSAVLLVIGVGSTIGNLWGGKLADGGVYKALLITLVLLLLSIVCVYLFKSVTVLIVAALFIWGVMSFATVPPLQINVVHAAERAPNLASTLNIGAFNIGNALGAYLGGVALTLFSSASGSVIASGGLALLALLLVVCTKGKV